jgi:type VI secretion system (T6SS) effector TldE1-like protein
MTRGRKLPVPERAAGQTFFGQLSFGIASVFLGIAGLSAVAAAAIHLPFPHGRSIFTPELRSSVSFATPAPDVDFGETWRERTHRVALGPRDGQDNAWMPEGGLSTLLATRFPHAGRVRFDVAAPLPLPRPDVERQDLASQDSSPQDSASQGVVRVRPVAVEPQLASLPPQPKSEMGILDKLFADPDRAAKAILAANPNAVLYDIVKKAVYLPDGEKLEAHSGYGNSLDDPASVGIKNYGVTPPNVYAVTLREKPFKGVRALRMKPVGGGNMYGRDGILAHSYLLGDQGASNGCLSVKDYDKFVQAYDAGKFDRIIVMRSADDPAPSQFASAQGSGSKQPSGL